MLKLGHTDYVNHELMNPVHIDNESIEFCHTAEHVGVQRSVEGNLPHILSTISAHKKSLAANLFTGLARNHRGNPFVSLKIEKLYSLPVLLKGLSGLVLSEAEFSLIDSSLKGVYLNLQKLLPRTPDCVIYFLGGCLPARAELHMKQLSVFGMICRKEHQILAIHAQKVLI